MKLVKLSFLFTNDVTFVGASSKGGGRNLGNKLYNNKDYDMWLLWEDGRVLGVVVACQHDHIMIAPHMVANWRAENYKDLDLPEHIFTVENRAIKAVNQHPDHRILPIKAQIGGPADVLQQVDTRLSAQVEMPHQKVQGKPGRKPKFQGEADQGE